MVNITTEMNTSGTLRGSAVAAVSQIHLRSTRSTAIEAITRVTCLVEYTHQDIVYASMTSGEVLSPSHQQDTALSPYVD